MSQIAHVPQFRASRVSGKDGALRLLAAYGRLVVFLGIAALLQIAFAYRHSGNITTVLASHTIVIVFALAVVAVARKLGLIELQGRPAVVAATLSILTLASFIALAFAFLSSSGPSERAWIRPMPRELQPQTAVRLLDTQNFDPEGVVLGVLDLGLTTQALVRHWLVDPLFDNFGSTSPLWRQLGVLLLFVALYATLCALSVSVLAGLAARNPRIKRGWQDAGIGIRRALDSVYGRGRSRMLRRVVRAFVLTLVLTLAYVYLHLPFSFMAPLPQGAGTVISFRTDVLVLAVITLLAALVIGRIAINRQYRLVAVIAALFFIACFVAASLELYLRNSPSSVSPWLQMWARQEAWINPFIGGRAIPERFWQIFTPQNFSLRGIGLAILSLASTARELNWYWVVVPALDSRFSFGIWWGEALLLNLMVAALVTLVAASASVVVTAILDSEPGREALPVREWALFRRIRWERWSKRTSYLVVAVIALMGMPWMLAALDANRVSRPIWHFVEPNALTIPAEVTSIALGEHGDDVHAVLEWALLVSSSDAGGKWSDPITSKDNSLGSLAYDTTSGFFYALRGSAGVVRSRDGGKTWESINPPAGKETWYSEVRYDRRKEALYAAGWSSGVWMSTSQGAAWRQLEPGGHPQISIFVLDERDGSIYVYGQGKFTRWDEGLESWVDVAQMEEPAALADFAVDTSEGKIFAVDFNQGLKLWTSGREAWEKIQTPGFKPRNAAYDAETRTLYVAAGRDGIFWTNDLGRTWQRDAEGLSKDEPVTILELGTMADGTKVIYAGTTGAGLFRSTDGGTTWANTTSRFIAEVAVEEAAIDEKGGWYVGVREHGVLRSIDAGSHWIRTNKGLQGQSFERLVAGPYDRVAAKVDSRVYVSANRGDAWTTLDVAPLTRIRGIALGAEGEVYVPAEREIYYTWDNGANWGVSHLLQAKSLSPVTNDSTISYGRVVQMPYGGLAWGAVRGGPLWEWLAQTLNLTELTLGPEVDGTVVGLVGQGGRLAYTEFTSAVPRIPLAWLAVRAIQWTVTRWIRNNTEALWMTVIGLLGMLAVMWAHTYRTFTRPYGLPWWTAISSPSHGERYASREALEQRWSSWRQAIRRELLAHGDVTSVDLDSIPDSFIPYALERYHKENDKTQMLQLYDGRLRLVARLDLRRWRSAWESCYRSLGDDSRSLNVPPATQKLAAVLVQAVGLTTLDEPREFESVRAQLVAAPAIRIKLPQRFPLLFVAASRPDDSTVEMLINTVSTLGTGDYFSLLVALEGDGWPGSAAGDLRRAVDASPRGHEFIILSGDDVTDTLIAPHPTEALTRLILKQVSLSRISPFVLSGPVAETMFFGREKEVKELVGHAETKSYAVVGNRKIGKTSLLKTAQAKIAAGNEILPLFVDCQWVRNESGFYAAFQGQTGIQLPALSPEGFAFALRAERAAGRRLVLIVDEVDPLAISDAALGEPLLAVWRNLAQDSVCQFILCGSRGLKLRLDESNSKLSNFVQEIQLGFLEPQTAELVLSRTLGDMGIEADQPEAIWREAVRVTSGHPYLVQYIGSELVRIANQAKHAIGLADLMAFVQSADFAEHYLKTVWGEAGPLERLITLIAPEEEFRREDLRQMLLEIGADPSENEFDVALRLLRLYSILARSNGRFKFVPTAFREILRQTQEVERLIMLEKSHLRRGRG